MNFHYLSSIKSYTCKFLAIVKSSIPLISFKYFLTSSNIFCDVEFSFISWKHIRWGWRTCWYIVYTCINTQEVLSTTTTSYKDNVMKFESFIFSYKSYFSTSTRQLSHSHLVFIDQHSLGKWGTPKKDNKLLYFE
jgi:hypothetical protein